MSLRPEIPSTPKRITLMLVFEAPPLPSWALAPSAAAATAAGSDDGSSVATPSPPPPPKRIEVSVRLSNSDTVALLKEKVAALSGVPQRNLAICRYIGAHRRYPHHIRREMFDGDNLPIDMIIKKHAQIVAFERAPGRRDARRELHRWSAPPGEVPASLAGGAAGALPRRPATHLMTVSHRRSKAHGIEQWGYPLLLALPTSAVAADLHIELAAQLRPYVIGPLQAREEASAWRDTARALALLGVRRALSAAVVDRIADCLPFGPIAIARSMAEFYTVKRATKANMFSRVEVVAIDDDAPLGARSALSTAAQERCVFVVDWTSAGTKALREPLPGARASTASWYDDTDEGALSEAEPVATNEHVLTMYDCLDKFTVRSRLSPWCGVAIDVP